MQKPQQLFLEFVESLYFVGCELALWNEVRLKTAAGMVTLRRRGDDVALVVFGNATPDLLAMRERIVAALANDRG